MWAARLGGLVLFIGEASFARELKGELNLWKTTKLIMLWAT